MMMAMETRKAGSEGRNCDPLLTALRIDEVYGYLELGVSG
jgi:hypothetical protein